ncbi:MAG TPA: hypothetical protein LFW20_03910 [Rickettsia endosymbiont of Omalisus fontisbellaquei]|nr:hypothetical protein [Rickettsia endosymbiont of Omalisus fontisbellaquei]
MTKQDTIHDEELCNAENMLNYFKYLHKNNKLEICGHYIPSLVNLYQHNNKSILYNILNLAINSKEYALINSMKQLVPNLKNYISYKNLKIIEKSYCSEGHERYLDLLGDSLE